MHKIKRVINKYDFSQFNNNLDNLIFFCTWYAKKNFLIKKFHNSRSVNKAWKMVQNSIVVYEVIYLPVLVALCKNHHKKCTVPLGEIDAYQYARKCGGVYLACLGTFVSLTTFPHTYHHFRSDILFLQNFLPCFSPNIEHWRRKWRALVEIHFFFFSNYLHEPNLVSWSWS